jgi:hypothetical protein
MAKLINTLLGKIKGTLGDLTFFQRGNEQHIKPRKHRHTKSHENSELARDNRRKFAQSHYFAKKLKRQKEIADFWKTVDIKGDTPYFKIHGYNRMKCTHDSLTDKNGITPDNITLTVENLFLKRNALSFSFKLYRTSDSYLKPPYRLFAVAYLNIGTMSMKLNDDSFHFKTVDINEEDSDFTNVNISFLEALSDVDIPEYKKLYFFIAAVKFIPENNNYEWSSSFFKSFDISNLSTDWSNTTELK